MTHRAAPSSTAGGGSDIARRGIHTEEGRETFMAQRLPTSSDHDEQSAGDSDEEIAVTFNPAPSSLRSAGNSPDKQLQNRVAATESTEAPPPQQQQEYGVAGVRGAARGAALMRRYEGNQRSVPPPAAASVGVEEAVDLEAGSEQQLEEEQAEDADLYASGFLKHTTSSASASTAEYMYEEADL